MSSPSHSSFLNERKREIIDSDGTAVPISFETLKRRARKQLKTERFDFAATGAGTEDTKQANHEYFDRWRIVPRVLRDVSRRDLSVQLFGRTLPAPLFLAPIGGQSVFADDGELATARAASKLDIPMILSTASSRSIEAVANELDDTPCFFQLYWMKNREVTWSLVERAERADYDGIVLTLDSQIPAWRVRNLRNRYSSKQDAERANFITDPIVQDLAGDGDTVSTEEATAHLSKDKRLTWKDLESLREHTSLPIILKGILHPADAARALKYGADGIVVSNHGGRQIDGEISSIQALSKVLDVVDGEIPVLLDSGVRSGADIFKALALGADAVLLGRPYAYGLALAGEQGVYEVIHNYLAELESVMGLSGYSFIREVDDTTLIFESDV